MAGITTGCYRHDKGNEYTVLEVARHSETLQERMSPPQAGIAAALCSRVAWRSGGA